MPYKIKFDQLPAGIAAESARAADDNVRVRVIGFLSTDDGLDFVKGVEGFPNDIISRLGSDKHMSPSKIDHMLVVISRDGSATVYINVLNTRIAVRVNKSIKKGDPVFKSDIVEVAQYNIQDVDIPNDCGVVYLFSVGWRKGYFYDFGPLDKTNIKLRGYDIFDTFAQLYSQMMFQEFFRANDSDWEHLFKTQLFPFAGLSVGLRRKMLEHVYARFDLSDLHLEIIKEVRNCISGWRDSWSKHGLLSKHMAFLEKAVDHYLKEEWIAANAIIYSRIEGIIRTHQAAMGDRSKATQKHLAAAAVANRANSAACALLPERFKSYLENVYFASFDPSDTHIPVSRNSFGHGVVSPEAVSELSASIGLLILHQLYYFTSTSE